MTVIAKVIKSDVKRSGANFVLENNGLIFEASFDAPLGSLYKYMIKNTKPGKSVKIGYDELSVVLNNNPIAIKSIDFIAA